LNKKAQTDWMSWVKPILTIAIILFIAYLIYQLVTKSAGADTTWSDFKIVDYLKNVAGIFKGTAKMVGYGEIEFNSQENYVNMFALAITSAIFLIMFVASSSLINLFFTGKFEIISSINLRLKNKESHEAAKKQFTETAKALFIVDQIKRNKFQICSYLFVVLVLIYLTIAFVPVIQILKPILLPLFSDYGQTLETSFKGITEPILSLFGKGTPEPASAYTGFWSELLKGMWVPLSLSFKKGFFTSVWLLMLTGIVYFLPAIIFSLIKSFMRAKAELELELAEEQGRKAILETAQGAQLLRTVRGAATK